VNARKLPDDPARRWALDTVRDAVSAARSRVGDAGWAYLSRDMREALISDQALRVVTACSGRSLPADAIWCLRRDMLLIAGLLDEETAP
jgi:hypothetical protein